MTTTTETLPKIRHGVEENQSNNWGNSRIKWIKKPGRKPVSGTNPRKIRWALYFDEKIFQEILREAEQLEIRPVIYLQEHIRRRKIFFNSMCEVYWKNRKALEEKEKKKKIVETDVKDLFKEA